MNDPPLVATDARDESVRPLDFETVHRAGIPHRGVHLEILRTDGNARRYFVWQRSDGRMEIPGGHCDWKESEQRAESYEESALREIAEELNLCSNWEEISESQIVSRLKGSLTPLQRIVNQVPSSHGANNEWVMVYRLLWDVGRWRDPCGFGPSEEGQRAPCWMTVEEIQAVCLEHPMRINAALRLFLRRRDILVPLLPAGSDSQR